MVRAMKSIDEPSLSSSVYGPTRSTQRASHEVLITILDGRCPYFCVRYSLGKSCMILFWIRWSLHSFPVYAAGGGRVAPHSAGGCSVQGADGCRNYQMPIPPVQGGAEEWVLDAAALLRLAPTGLRCGQEGRVLPSVQMLRDAGRPNAPDTHPHGGVLGGNSTSPPAEHVSAVSTCLAPAVHGAR